MEYKTHFYSLFLLLIAALYWRWPFKNLLHQSNCGQYTPPKVEIQYPFESWQECRESVEQDRSSSLKTNLNLPLEEEIKARGYNLTTYTIQSSDGYISTIYRIAGSEKSQPRFGKQAVLLFHGGFGGSLSWTIQPGSRNLPMLLVEAGYEAWIASLRGTIPSQNHTHLDSKNDLEYWDFDFEDIGTKDLPHFVNLILKETGTEKVYFVCHSGGCISYTTGLVEKPELNKKFKAAFYLAPGTFIGSSYNPVLQLWASIVGSPLERILIRALKGRVDGEQGWLATTLGLTPQSLCSRKYLRCGVCDSVFFALYGNNAMQLNYTELPTILEKLQDTFSLKTLIHAMQNYKNCSLRKYDHGKERNLEKYGSFEPPHYDLERIAVPIYLFYGESDNMVTPDDVRKTRDAIPSRYMHGFYRVEWPSFNHVDFLTAKDADILLYNKILNIMQNLDSES